ncbi:hypothetical protein [Bradyrhizobium sp. USDA 10063]
MIRLACPDTAQARRISESFGLAILDSDGIRDLHERLANKTRAMQLQAGHPQQKGSRRGPAYTYNIKALRDRDMLIAAQAEEQGYERFVAQWKPRRPKTGARAPQRGRTK